MMARLYALLAVCFGVRLLGITHPLLGHQAWRQTDTWAISQRIGEWGNPTWPMVYWGGGGVVAMEAPLYNTLLVAFGGSASMGRLLSAVLSTTAVYVFYRLVERANGPLVALWSAGFFGLLPMSWYFGRAVMPESLLMLASVASVWMMQRWLESRWAGDAMGTALALAVTGLVKPYGLLVLLPMAGLVRQDMGERPRPWAGLAFIVAVAMVPVVWWYLYASNLASIDGLAIFDASPGVDKWGQFGLVLEPEYWNKVLLRRISGKLLCWGLVPLAAYGFLRGEEWRLDPMFRWWLLGGLAHLVLVARGNEVHDYYQLPLLPPLCAAAGFAVVTAQFRGNTQRAAAWFLVGLTLVIGAPVFDDLMRRETAYDARLPASEACAASVPADAKVIAVGDDRSPVLLNLCQREGWILTRDELDHDTLLKLKDEGAAWLVSPWPVDVEGTVRAENSWMVVEL